MRKAIVAPLSAALAAATAAAQTPVSDPRGAAYICSDGRLMEVRRDKALGVVTLVDGKRTLTAFETVGKGPSRFVAGEVTIDAFENHLLVTGGRLDPLACPRRPDGPEPGTLFGTLAKRDRKALPRGSRARIVLADVSRMDAPAEEIAATTVTTTGNQAPLHFLLRYDPARIEASRRHAVLVRLELPDGRLAYVTSTLRPVLAGGPAEPRLDLVLTPATP
ncbi:YbaY family lipoprotein [Thermaurantiacus sp.]